MQGLFLDWRVRLRHAVSEAGQITVSSPPYHDTTKNSIATQKTGGFFALRYKIDTLLKSTLLRCVFP